jgi:methyl-accepting chemotaxis protein
MSEDRDYWQLAARFVDFVHKETGLLTIVCDEQGIIRQAVVKARIGTPHAGAARIMRDQVDEVFVTAEDAARDPKVKEGYNCPIIHDGRRIGTFGIAGPLEVTRPMARVSAAVLASWLKELEQQRALGAATGQVLQALTALSEELAAAEGSAKATLASVTSASGTAGERLGSVDEALRGVHAIAQQSRMLAINASVEATRAGDQGRAFGVIAREMLTLADDARTASAQIQGSLREVGGAVTQLVQAGRTSSDESARLVAAMARMVERIEGLRGVIDGLGGSRQRLEGRAGT